MPRTARTLTPQTTYHILARGNNRQPVFHEPPDYETYRRLLLELLAETPTLRCYHYCLMPNHVHLLLYTEHAQAMVTTLQRLQLSYAWYHRRIYQTSGHLWQGRYKSLPILDDPYLLEAGRYIERNALEAKLAEKLEAYPWSSYRWTGFGEADPLCHSQPGLSRAGSDTSDSPTCLAAVHRANTALPNPSTEQLAGVFQGW